MKSIINNISKKKEEYPCLKRWKDSNLIVLFTGKNKGFCVCNDGFDFETGNKIGDSRDLWIESDFVSLHSGESVTLSND